MSLDPDTKLGPYEIISPLGAGSMGEVYKAKDTRLDRTVAIKVLPSHLSDNAELKQRFEREARTISSLNHPHICTLYDVGEKDGVDYLVMEYLEGETLADRLKKGALPFDQALRYGMEIADALDKAHQRGVVHRDLKPGNIMITQSGAKLLDFGLAKLRADVSAEPSSRLRQGFGEAVSALPTQQKPLTEKGSIIGTFQYMAPEQLEGKDADSRTDIFAFGNVLYEVLTGKKAFEGKSQASLISAIMSSEPRPVSELKPMSPSALDRTVKRCLEKDPDKRWQSANDLAAELTWIGQGGGAGAVVETKPGFPLRYGAAIIVALLLAGLAGWQLKPSSPPDAVTRFSMMLPPTEQLTSQGRTAVALSPDGSQLVYVANERLYLRSMDQIGSTPIQGTDEAGSEARAPIISPDGKWVAFHIAGKLKKTPVGGGTPVTLCDAAGHTGSSWGPNDTIVFGETGKGILRVSADGGKPQVLIPLDPAQGEFVAGSPQILPDGETVLFTVIGHRADVNPKIVAQSLTTGERRVLVERGTDARYVSTGHLIYAVEETLLAAPFDLERLQVTGGAVSAIENVLNSGRAAHFSFSNTGSLVYRPPNQGIEGSDTLAWVDRTGLAVPVMEELTNAYSPRFSPDGKHLAFLSYGEAETDIWVYDLERGSRIRLTHEGLNIGPV